MEIDVFLLLLLFLILLLLLILLFLWFRWRPRESKPPVVLFQAWDRTDQIENSCGKNGVLYTNLAENMNVNVEVKNLGDCQVTLDTGQNKGFLVVPNLPPGRGGAAVQLRKNDAIAYSCKTDEAPNPQCVFWIKITRI